MLLDPAAALESRPARRRLAFGAWHGDWTPWNMASTAGGLLVWDWERFATGVPVGFDALHYWLQIERRRPPPRPADGSADEPDALRRSCWRRSASDTDAGPR